MIEKLNVSNIYHTNSYKLHTNMYYVSIASDRGMCFSCKYDLSCPYSYMKLYRDRFDNVIKCMRYVPIGDEETRHVGLYFNENTRLFNRYLMRGWIYDR